MAAFVRTANTEIWVGLSTDTKPTGRPDVVFSYETDTGDCYISKDGGTTWTLDKRGEPWPIL